MKAAVLLDARTPLSIEESPSRSRAPREVLIRTVACGVCHSDLHFVDGAYPHPLPSSPATRRRAWSRRSASEVRTVKVGDHVVTCFTAFCGHCEYCVTGRMSLCVDARQRRPKGDAAAAHARRWQRRSHQMLNLVGLCRDDAGP